MFLLEEADYLFIPRFDARNVKINGKEALVVLVDGEQEQIEEFVGFVKTNKPEKAVIKEIRIEEYKGRVRDIERFRASFNTAQLSKIVQVGLKMLEKRDSMLQKQDETINEIRITREDLKKEIKEVSSKLDKTNELLERRFEKLEEEIERIKKALIKAGIKI